MDCLCRKKDYLSLSQKGAFSCAEGSQVVKEIDDEYSELAFDMEVACVKRLYGCH